MPGGYYGSDQYSDTNPQMSYEDDYMPPSQISLAQPYKAQPVINDLNDANEFLCCGLLSPLPAGYCVCFLALVEGLVILFDVMGVIDQDSGLFSGLDQRNPFAAFEWKLLGIMGTGDLVFALFGACGLWLSTNVMPFTVRYFDLNHASICSTCINLFVVWRGIVAVIVAPWVGLMLAFEPDTYDKTQYVFWTVVYVAACVYVLWVLIFVARACIAESQLVQEFLRMQARDERQQLVERSRMNDVDITNPEDTEIFGCLPLEPTLAVYMLVLMLGHFMSLVYLLGSGRTLGGWAFLTQVPNVDMTYWLEALVYFFSSAFSLLGFCGIIFYRSAMDSEDEVKQRMLQAGSGQDAVGYSEDLELSSKMRKRCAVFVLMYLIETICRFALFFPITGMVLLEKNVCGYYVRGLASVSIAKAASVPMHCTSQDVATVVLLTLVMLLDLYLVNGICRLWFLYRVPGARNGRFTLADEAEVDALPAKAASGKIQASGYYGTAMHGRASELGNFGSAGVPVKEAVL